MSAPEDGISIREFARRESVSDKLVRQALKSGHLRALSDGKLSAGLVGTGWCERNRRRADSADKGADTPHQVSAPVRTSADPLDDADGDFAIANVLAGRATQAEAERVRANGQAVKVMLEARQRSGELMEVAEAEAVVFEIFRAARDSWMNWPARIGPLVAADLNMEADRVTEVLTAHVHQHLLDLGEPDPQFG